MPNLRKLGPGCGLAIGLESLLNLIVKLQFGPFISDNVNALITDKPNLKVNRKKHSDSLINVDCNVTIGTLKMSKYSRLLSISEVFSKPGPVATARSPTPTAATARSPTTTADTARSPAPSPATAHPPAPSPTTAQPPVPSASTTPTPTAATAPALTPATPAPPAPPSYSSTPGSASPPSYSSTSGSASPPSYSSTSGSASPPAPPCPPRPAGHLTGKQVTRSVYTCTYADLNVLDS